MRQWLSVCHLSTLSWYLSFSPFLPLAPRRWTMATVMDGVRALYPTLFPSTICQAGCSLLSCKWDNQQDIHHLHLLLLSLWTILQQGNDMWANQVEKTESTLVTRKQADILTLKLIFNTSAAVPVEARQERNIIFTNLIVMHKMPENQEKLIKL